MATRTTRSTTTSEARVAPPPKATKPRTTTPKSATPKTTTRAKKAVMGKTTDTTLAANAMSAPEQKAVTPEERWTLIAERAYYLAAERNFAPGGEVADWLTAEAEVDRELRGA